MNKYKYCIANWKMNFDINDVKLFLDKWLKDEKVYSDVKIIICPSFTEIKYLIDNCSGKNIEVGSQNVCFENKGAFTGEISSKILSSLGCKWVIIGHSERRTIFNEQNKIIKKKLKNLLFYGLNPILCIGETQIERKNNNVIKVLKRQLSVLKGIDIEKCFKFAIAYEPVWAIGTGMNATNGIIEDTFENIKKILSDMNINLNKISLLYGGSVNEKNAESISNILDVDGFLIGGASLDADKFYNIYKKL